MRLILLSCLMIIPLVLGIPFARQCVEGASTITEPRVTNNITGADCLIYASGIVESECREVCLRFERAGRLAALTVTEGSAVRQGDVMAKLDSELWELELAKAEAALTLAEAEKLRLLNGMRQESIDVVRAEMKVAQVSVHHAERNLQRALILVQRNAVPEQESDDRRAKFESARAEFAALSARVTEMSVKARPDDVQIADAKIAVAAAQVRSAQKEIDMCNLRAPRDGTVSRIQGEPGELVGPATPDALITLVGGTPQRVRAYVEELDAVRVRADMRASVVADGMPGCSLTGRVITCSPAMIAKTMITNNPSERRDTKVREVIIALDEQGPRGQLVIGLPVEVRLDQCRE